MNFELREQVLFDLYQMKLSKKAVPLRADLRLEQRPLRLWSKDRFAKGIMSKDKNVFD